MHSIRSMICLLEGFLGTSEISEWESGFITSLAAKADATPSDKSIQLTEKQLDKLEDLYAKHFN